MKKLVKMFKKLPPEVRMLLAMAGLGSPVGAIYFLRRFFPGVSLLTIVLWAVGAALVIALLVFLITTVFKRRGKKRTQRMAEDLAGDAQAGPQSIDAGAAIKANNEKFFGAIKDMRKTAGLNVYDLPWYVVIGDSGCGKTRLINEGDLMFSTGKPEGYQLGTLNYNWWFTEDAIFIDMAGRLCNPQDDGDRREWAAFLDTVGKGRKGFPINGALVCISADHLLEDGPEKHEQDANIALERLRDLQVKLGVTFATYLVVTKCDKILGFLQLFDRAGDQFAVKKQIFGWSRAGAFNTPYDPQGFGTDFAQLYARLNDLRLSRLNDDADERELGLAYSFPEEFRRFHDPLDIYVRTLFPMRRKSKAIKDLILRGVYFTSATQEGGVITKHLTERLGAEAADYFQPLDLYPKKQPYFIRDVLFRKVFPEHGLVFRNEKQVVRNKKLSQLLKIGTAVLTVVLVVAFWWSSSEFTRVIGEPREHAERAAREIQGMTPLGALELAETVRADAVNLRAAGFATGLLSLGLGRNEPINHLERIRVRLLEQTMVQSLAAVEGELRSGALLEPSAGGRPQVYLDALVEYVRWQGCMGRKQSSSPLTAKGFETLCAVVTDPDSIARQEGLREQADWYFGVVNDGGRLERNPAWLLNVPPLDPAKTISAAIDHLHGHFGRMARLAQDGSNEVVRRWMRIRQACDTVQTTYAEMLDSASDARAVETLDDLLSFRNVLDRRYENVDQALDECSTWSTEDELGRGVPIKLLSTAVLLQRGNWMEYLDSLREAAGACSASDASVLTDVDSLRSGRSSPPRDGLDLILWRSLTKAGIVRVAYQEGVYDEAEFKRLVTEVFDIYGDILDFNEVEGGEANDRLSLTMSAVEVRGRLGKILGRLAGAKLSVPDDLVTESAADWIEQLDRHLEQLDALEDARDAEGKDSGLPSYWQPEPLARLEDLSAWWAQLGEGTRILQTVSARLQTVGDWGAAELMDYGERAREIDAPFGIDPPPRPGDRDERVRDRADEPVKKRRRSGRRQRELYTRDRQRESAPASAPRESRHVRQRGRLKVPVCATHEFANNRAFEWANLLLILGDTEGAYLAEQGSDEPLHVRCRNDLSAAVKAYGRAYYGAWADAYDRKELKELARLTEGVTRWDVLARQLGRGPAFRGVSGSKVGDELYEALEWLLKSVPWLTYDTGVGWWEQLAQDGPEWGDLTDWVKQTRRETWDDRKLGAFAFNPISPARTASEKEMPWALIAEDFRSEWRSLAKGIGEVADLPRRFDNRDPDDAPNLGAIPWGGIQTLRETYGLRDEKLTGALVEFENHARRLLSRELNNRLYDIQEKYFPAGQPYDGWPYLRGKDYTDSGLNVVNFADFKNFLIEIDRAHDAFKEVEKSLGDRMPGRRERRTFYAACRAWYEFLNFTSNRMDPEPKPGQMFIVGADPTREPFGKEKVSDSAQQEANKFIVELGPGFEPTGTFDTPGRLSISTLTEEKVKKHVAHWNWAIGADQALRVRLGDHSGATVNQQERTLGRYSPLALPAYLHRYGVPKDNGKTWYMTHSFKQRIGGTGRCGEKIVLTWTRSMPGPIAKLQEVSNSQTRDR